MAYASLEQRMARSYLDLFPRFIPDEAAPVSVREQERLYTLMKSLYRLAFDEPLLFVPALHGDDAYPNRFHKASYGKPELQLNMKKFIKAMNALLQNMFQAGQNPDVKWNKRQKAILEKLGIGDFSDLPPAWVWMSTRPDASLTAFSYCLFQKDYPYTTDIYAKLLGESPFRRLESWMLENGYQRYDLYDVTASDCKLSLTYANPLWGKEPPNGGFEYKIKHTGISVRYDYYTTQPTVLGLCIPNGLKDFLTAFDSMDDNLQEFVVERTKKCDGCRYCVQTDKTGTRPFAYIPVIYEQKTHSLCPYFPGYHYCWTALDDGLIERLISFLAFMDRYQSRK